jgi:hypothetical protein
MTSVTTRRRGPQRVDARRRQGRGGGQLPTLFDAAPGDVTVRVDAPGGATVRVSAPGEAAVRVSAPGEAAARVDSGQRVAAPPMTAGHGETLDRLVVSSWERLAGHADALCLVCGGTMEPGYGAHAAPIGGRCRDCGTTLG